MSTSSEVFFTIIPYAFENISQHSICPNLYILFLHHLLPFCAKWSKRMTISCSSSTLSSSDLDRAVNPSLISYLSSLSNSSLLTNRLSMSANHMLSSPHIPSVPGPYNLCRSKHTHRHLLQLRLPHLRLSDEHPLHLVQKVAGVLHGH